MVALDKQRQYAVVVVVAVVVVGDMEMKAVVVVATPNEGCCVNCSFLQMASILKSKRDEKEKPFLSSNREIYT